MKIMKLLLIGVVFLVAVSISYAIPEISYTNFARTAGGGLVLNSTVNVRITIYNSGVTQYQEVFSGVATNGYGLFTVKLGTGVPVGPDTYDALVAVNSLNVQSETDAGDGYRFVQLSPLLNTALKNEEAAGIVTLNDAYLNGDSIEVLAGVPVTLSGTGLIQSDATIAAINANGDKTLTTKEYVDNGISIVANNPFLVWQDASADLPNSKILNGEVGVINFDASTATLSIMNDGISEPKLKMANAPANGYIIKWNGTDMTWADPTVITSHPVVGDGTVGNPITLYTTGVNANEVLFFNGTQWTNGQVTTDMIADGTITNGDINAATKFVSVTGEAGTPFDITNGNLALDFQGTGSTTVTLDQTTHTVYIEAGIVADIPLSGAGTASDHLILNYDATLDLDGNNLGFNHNHQNTWLTTQTFSPATDEPGIIIDGTNATSGNALVVSGAVKNDYNYDVYFDGDFYVDGFSNFFNNNTAATSFAIQAVAYGEIASLPGLPSMAQGLTGIAQYTGATPSTNLVIGTVGLGQAGNGAISIGVYGGSRDENQVANVGVVGHAYNDATGTDINHGVVGIVSQLPAANNEMGLLLSMNLNSAVTGVNLGANANDWAAYFIGKVKANQYVGNLQYSLVDGPGIKTFTFNNSANATVEVDYDATLKIDGSDMLGLDLGHSNTWTADQYLPASNAQGNNLVASINTADAQSLNGDVVNYDATLQVTANELGIDLDHSNTWTADQYLPASNAQGNNLVASINTADVQSLNGDVVNYDATLQVTANELGLDLGHSNNWTADQYFGANVGIDGDLFANGNVSLGTNNLNTVTFNALVNSDIVPDHDNDHSLGTSSLRWKDLFLGPGSLHIGNSTDEGVVSFDLLNDWFDFNHGIYVNGDASVMGDLWVDVTAHVGGDVDVDGDVTVAGYINGGFADGSLLFADASGNIAGNNINLSWDNNNHTLVLDGNILIAGGSSDPEIWVNGGQGVRLDAGATLKIGDGGTSYKMPITNSDPTKFLALNATSDELVWWTYDNTISVDTTNNIIGLNQNAPFNFTNIVAFNPASGSAISATSSDPSAPTVVIEHTDPYGVALQLTGAEGQTTALEITTGGINVGNGQMIVSSNSGVTGSDPNGPTLTLNNNGDGVSENGGALQILEGHAAFAYSSFTVANPNDPFDLSTADFTILDCASNGNNSVTLPSSSVAADNLGTIIYIINSGSGTLNLPGTLGNVNAGTSAQLVYTNAGWFRLH